MDIKKTKYITLLKSALENQNFKLISESNDLFVVENENKSIYKLQLVVSEPINIEMHGSHNGNIVDGIGVFDFEWPYINNMPEYFILAFENLINKNIEFVVIAASELLRRLTAIKRIVASKAYFWLWLMDDCKVYETTYISLEGEWYFLSKGYARVADGKEMEYSEFLNNLSEILIL
jgi:hypothetical protein